LYLQQAAALIASVNLLFIPAPPSWMIGSIAALLLVNLGGLFYTRRMQSPGKLLLRDDDTVLLKQGRSEYRGNLLPSAWVSRWLCVLRWKPLQGRSRPCLVCCGANRFDDYRRLLVRLRLGGEA
jgi:hypothetical protein